MAMYVDPVCPVARQTISDLENWTATGTTAWLCHVFPIGIPGNYGEVVADLQ